MAGGSFPSNTIVHGPPRRIASGMISATSRRTVSARFRHQPSGGESITLLPGPNVPKSSMGDELKRPAADIQAPVLSSAAPMQMT